MAGVIQADYLQPTSSAGLTILTPSGNTIMSMNTAGIFSSGSSLFVAANGQVLGFGTSFPGTVTANTVTANTVQIGQSGSSSNNFTLYQPSTPDGTVRLGNGNAGSVTDLLTLTSAGNLGIGTTSPLAKISVGTGSISDPNVPIQINSASGAASWIGFNKSGTYGGLIGFANATGVTTTGLTIRSVTSDPIIFTVNNTTEAMYLNSSGNLGLGVSPSVWNTGAKAQQILNGLSLFSTSSTPTGFITNNHAWTSSVGDAYLVTGYGSSYYKQYNGTHSWAIAPSGTAGNAISFSQAMTLDASGQLGIGTSSPLTSLHVSTQNNSSKAAAIFRSGNASYIMLGKIINSYNNAVATNLISFGTGGNSGVMVKIVIRGTSATSNQMWEDVGYAWWRWSSTSGYVGSGVSTVTTVSNVAGTHTVGTLSWSNPSTAPILKYTQSNNGYILESIDVYVSNRDNMEITMYPEIASYG